MSPEVQLDFLNNPGFDPKKPKSDNDQDDQAKKKLDEEKALSESGIEIVEEKADKDSKSPEDLAVTEKILSDSGIVIDKPEPRRMADGFPPGSPTRWEDEEYDDKNGIKRPYWDK